MARRKALFMSRAICSKASSIWLPTGIGWGGAERLGTLSWPRTVQPASISTPYFWLRAAGES